MSGQSRGMSRCLTLSSGTSLSLMRTPGRGCPAVLNPTVSKGMLNRGQRKLGFGSPNISLEGDAADSLQGGHVSNQLKSRTETTHLGQTILDPESQRESRPGEYEYLNLHLQ